MRNKKVIIVMILSLILMTGYSDDECVESHTEKSTCVMYQTLPKPNGGVQILPMFYSCEKTVCDRYESEATDE